MLAELDIAARAPRSLRTIYESLVEVSHALSSQLSRDINLWRRCISLIRWPEAEVPL